MSPDEQRLARRARARAWTFTRDDAVECGISRRTASRRINAGAWLELNHHALTFAWAPATWERAAMAALLALGEQAGLSHAAALRVWRMSSVTPPLIDVTTTGRVQKALPDVRIHTPRALLPIDLTRVGIFRATRVAWTIVDVAPTLGVVRLEDLVVNAERRWPGTERRLRDVLERRPKAPASGLVREVVARFDPAEAARLMSWLETTYLRVFKEAGLPPPVVNCRLRDASGNIVAKVDFIWPHASLVVEVDGLRWHSSPSQKQHDARQNRIVLSGRRVLRYSKADLADTARVVAEIRSALAMATPVPLL